MTRFTTQHNVKVGSTNLAVVTRPATDLSVLAAATNHLKAARIYLECASIAVNRPGGPSASVREYAHRYFLTQKSGISLGDLQRIQTVINMTRTGLESDVTIKTGAMVGRKWLDNGTFVDKDVHGSVRPRELNDMKHDYHNPVVDLDDGKTYRMGAIRIDDKTLGSEVLGLVTLIHEATHKFAGTNDYCYFKKDGITPDGTFNDRAEALKNADSYAWFVYKCRKVE